MKTFTSNLILVLIALFISPIILGQIVSNNDIVVENYWSANDQIKGVEQNTNLETSFLSNMSFELVQFVDSVLTFQYQGETDSVLTSKTINTFNENNQVGVAIKKTYVDSTDSWINVSKYEYEYDQFGNRVYSKYHNWSSELMNWVNSTKLIYVYEASGDYVLRELWRWDTELEQWYGFYKYTYEYNENGDKTREQKWNWSSEMTDWVNNYYYTYDYNEYGRTLYERWRWDADSAYWYGQNRNETLYDDSGNNFLNFSYVWENGDWIYLWKYENNFDTSGNDTLTYMFSWNADSALWENMRKTTREYTTFNAYQIGIDYNWDADSNAYLPDRRYYREYDQFEQETLYEYNRWSDELSGWEPNQLYEYAYDEYGNQVENIKWIWENDSIGYLGDFARIYEYDNMGNMLLNLLFSWSSEMNDWEGWMGERNCFDDNNFKYMTTHLGWSDSTFHFYQDTRDFYYYRTNLGIDDLNNNEVLIYPNPTKNFIYLKTSSDKKLDIRIIDQIGRFVFIENNHDSGQPIDIRNIAPGVYLIHTYNGTLRKGGKFVIQ